MRYKKTYKKISLYSSSLKPTITLSSDCTIGRLRSIGSFLSHSSLPLSSKFNSFSFKSLYFVPRELKTKSIPAF